MPSIWKRTVAANNHNLELLAKLALVDGRVLCNWVTIDGALDVGDGIRVSASGCWVELGVTFEVDVEPDTELLAAAEVGTLLDIVGAILNVLVSQVTNLLSSAGLIRKLLLVPGGSARITSSFPESIVGVLVSGHGSIARLGTSTVDVMSQTKSYTTTQLTLQAEERMHR